MIRKILIWVIVLFVIQGCQKNNRKLPDLKKPKTILCKCQNDTWDKYYRKEERYYEDSKLVKEKINVNRDLYFTFVYKYNDYGFLIRKEEFYNNRYRLYEYEYQYDDDLRPVKKYTRSYKLDQNGNTVSDGEWVTVYLYENGLLVNECGSSICYDFKYNDNDEQIEKKVVSPEGFVYDTYEYEYRHGIKVKEILRGIDNEIDYTKEFIYDPFGHLIKIVKDGKIIEKNKYLFNKLVEKKTYYYGRDPGFSPCQGNYIYTYLY